MAVRQDLSGGDYQIVIRDVVFSDAGEYECQVNTDTLLSHTITLAVVGKMPPFLSLSLMYLPASSVQTN